LLSLLTCPGTELNLFDENRVNLRGPDKDRRGEVRRFRVSIGKIAALRKIDLSAFDSINPFKTGRPGAGQDVAQMTKWGDFSSGRTG